jgi:hypothetical protein
MTNTAFPGVPDNISEYLFSFLTPVELCVCYAVSTNWRAVVKTIPFINPYLAAMCSVNVYKWLQRTQYELSTDLMDTCLHYITVGDLFSLQHMLEGMKYTRSELKYTRSELKCTRSELKCTRSELKCTRSELKCTRSELKCTPSELKCTRSELKCTRSELKCTRSELKCTRSELNKLVRHASELGQLPIMKWFSEQLGYSQDYTAVAESGSIECLEWLKSIGCTFPSFMCAYAVEAKHFEVLKWLRKNGADWGRSMELSLASKQYDVFTWCLTEGAPITKNICPMLAGSGNLMLLMLVVEAGGIIDTPTCIMAAKMSQFDVLNWFVEEDVVLPMDEMFEQAFTADNQQVIEWLMTQAEMY